MHEPPNFFGSSSLGPIVDLSTYIRDNTWVAHAAIIKVISNYFCNIKTFYKKLCGLLIRPELY